MLCCGGMHGGPTAIGGWIAPAASQQTSLRTTRCDAVLLESPVSGGGAGWPVPQGEDESVSLGPTAWQGWAELKTCRASAPAPRFAGLTPL